MGVLDRMKNLLVENDNSDMSEVDFENLLKQTTPQPQIDININVQMEGLLTIQDIFEQNNIADLSKSIYQVQKLKDVLPANLPNESKKTSVEGTMQLFQLNKDEVVSDGNNRVDILNAIASKITEETMNILKTSNTEIENLLAQINELKTKMQDRQKLQEEQDKIIQSEIGNIKDILTFII